MKQLDVYYDMQKAGKIISDNQGVLSFKYDNDWVTQNKPVLSAQLSLSNESYSDTQIRKYLANLLPEESALKQLTNILKIDSNNLFDLLYEIGRDCSGAVSFWPHDAINDISKNNKSGYKLLSQLAWEDWINDDSPFPLLNNPDDEVRLSLAGAQIKALLYFEGDVAYQGQNGAPSTHIIKPPHRWISTDLVKNELVCLRLARAMGINTAQADIWKGCLRIKRYDRKHTIKNGQTQNIRRLHQEDFCQLLGRMPEQKYESISTPESLFGQCFNKLDELGSQGILKTPAIAKLALLDLIIFNILIWNTDAHLKNFSILYNEHGDCHLAPAYDLISTRKLFLKDEHGKKHNMASKLAIGIGGEKIISQIKHKNWQKFSLECGLSPKLVFKHIKSMAEKIYDHSQSTIYNDVNSSYNPSTWDSLFLETIKQQRDRAFSWLNEI